jgi:ribosomal protein L5
LFQDEIIKCRDCGKDFVLCAGEQEFYEVQELTMVTGQKAVATMSKKDISNFKLRKDMPIGAKVTLRGVNMYEFLDRLVSVSLPRVRDFKGISDKSFDGRGNYTLGVTEQIIFPEVDVYLRVQGPAVLLPVGL